MPRFRLAAKNGGERIYKFSLDRYREMGMLTLVVTSYIGPDNSPCIDLYVPQLLIPGPAMANILLGMTTWRI